MWTGIFFRDVTHGNSEIKDELGYNRMILRYLENRNAEFNADIEMVKDINAQMSPNRSNNFASYNVFSPPIPVRTSSFTAYQTHSPPIPTRQSQNTAYNTHSSRTNPYR